MKRILIIDDNELIRIMLSRYLEHCGYQTLTASSGLEGIEVFGCCQDLIDLVLTDLRMPVMTGKETVHQLRKIKPNVNVICMSGCLDDSCPQGVTLLQKPFGMDALRNIVHHAFPPDPACPSATANHAVALHFGQRSASPCQI